MKCIASVFLMVLIVFLSMPTVVAVAKAKSDTNRFFASAEEEVNANSWNEILHKVSLTHEYFSFNPYFKTSLQLDYFATKRILAVTKTILIPPPKK